jgi:hypothetical protein
MKNVLILAGSGMGAFLDFGVGMMITALFAIIAEYPLAPWHLLVGGILGFLPDFDIIPLILRRKYATVADHHTTLMHRPIIVLPIATALAWLIGGNFWAIVTVLCVSWHYFHDTRALSDGGIDLFWPLPARVTGFVEPPRVDLIDWLRWRWFKPTTFALTELKLGSLGMFIGVFQVLGSPAAIAAVVACWIGFAFVWLMPDKYKY